MSPKPVSPRVFCVFALFAALVLASLPAQARPFRRPPADRPAVAAAGDSGLASLWHLLVGLWPGVRAKEGVTIDPNGSSNHAGTQVVPPGDLVDEGTSIDPDGSR
jgi:hypothetical protein